MNRRSFFGFACGGIVAAPAAVLMGEKVLDYADGRLAVTGDRPQVSVMVTVDRDGEWLAKATANSAAKAAEHESMMAEIRRENSRNREAAMKHYSSRKG